MELITAIIQITFIIFFSLFYFIGWKIEEEVDGTHPKKRKNKVVFLSGIGNLVYCLLLIIYEVVAYFLYPPMELSNVLLVWFLLTLLPLFYWMGMSAYVYKKREKLKKRARSTIEVKNDEQL